MLGFKSRYMKSGIDGLCHLLESVFNVSTGHDHDGVDSKTIPLLDASTARADGLGMVHVYSATIDATSGLSVAAHGLDVSVHADMLVVGGAVDVVKTFTDGDDDSATIAIHVVGANDVVTATAISAGGNIWDQGRHDIIPDCTGSTALKTTAASEITATVADAALTDGKAVVYLYCVKATADVA